MLSSLKARRHGGLLAVCLMSLAGLVVGCRPEPEFVLESVTPRMTIEQAEGVAGKPIGTIGDESFSWRWYKGGLVIGFSRSTESGHLESCWIAQTEGSYGGGRLFIGDKWSRAERLFGETGKSTGQPRIHLGSRGGLYLDILASADKVAAFILYLAPGENPDVRLVGYEPGTMPEFRLPREGGINIFPLAQGSTLVYLEYDDAGGSTLVSSAAMEPVEVDEHTLVPVRNNRGEAPAVTFYYALTGDIVTLVSDSQMGTNEYPSASPSRIYPGLEWSVGGLTYRVIGQEDITVPAGAYPHAYVVECSSTLVPTRTLIYYADGIGLVKEDDRLELIEFTPGRP